MVFIILKLPIYSLRTGLIVYNQFYILFLVNLLIQFPYFTIFSYFGQFNFSFEPTFYSFLFFCVLFLCFLLHTIFYRAFQIVLDLNKNCLLLRNYIWNRRGACATWYCDWRYKRNCRTKTVRKVHIHAGHGAAIADLNGVRKPVRTKVIRWKGPPTIITTSVFV